MASAYSTFADRGKHTTPYSIRRIEDSDGNVLFDAADSTSSTQVVSTDVADTVNSVLNSVIDKGTGTAAQLGWPAAGKTGTTSDAKDAWFTGYTCHLTTSVWMGYRQPKEMTDYKGRTVAGGTFPAQMWHDYMAKATKADAPCTFPATDAGTKILNRNLSADGGHHDRAQIVGDDGTEALDDGAEGDRVIDGALHDRSRGDDDQGTRTDQGTDTDGHLSGDRIPDHAGVTLRARSSSPLVTPGRRRADTGPGTSGTTARSRPRPRRG